MSPQSTKAVVTSKVPKPAKPYDGFPLFPHATKRWAKKIRGKLHYFGAWDDPYGALEKFQVQRDDLYAGRKPRTSEGFTVRQACNHFLTSKRQLVDTGELTVKTWDGYYLACRKLIEFFGDRLVDDLRSDDFEAYRTHIAKTNRAVGIKNNINLTRMVFRYAYEAELIDRPVRFGPGFKTPSKRIIRQQRKPKMLEASQIRQLLDTSPTNMKAMILFGVNCGFGCTDVELLPTSAIDFDKGWVHFARNKTGTMRDIPLWSETMAAVKDALTQRPASADAKHAGLLFLTSTGGSYHKPTTNYVSQLFRDLLMSEGLHREGLGFYCLRHVFETIGGDSKDQVAVDAIMGHERGDMASEYRERIDPKRLVDVVGFVRGWLFETA